MGPPLHMKLLLIIILFTVLLQYCHGTVLERAKAVVELEKQRKILNKTSIKTIQTEVGDVFDCIDINNQPSLNHPLLKNHVIKTRPISYSINTKVEDNHHETVVSTSSSSSSSSVKLSRRIAVLRKLGCPDGTVPIRRTSKEDLIRAKSFSKSQVLFSNINNVGDDSQNSGHPGVVFSIAETRKDSGINYLGIQARINLYNPPVAEDQVSTAQVWIENGDEKDFNSLQAGWIVAPSLFGDGKTRLFATWQVHDSNRSEGCYNTLCPGFVQVEKDYPLGDIVVDRLSEFGGKQYDIEVTIQQDGSGNWWLNFEDTMIGYWPAELGFSKLIHGTSFMAWGGLAAQLGTVATAIPPTGNGHYPSESFLSIDLRRQCYMRVMKVKPAKTLHWEDPTRQIMDTIETKTDCSKIKYHGQLDKTDLQHTITFGGPGGNCLFNYGYSNFEFEG